MERSSSEKVSFPAERCVRPDFGDEALHSGARFVFIDDITRWQEDMNFILEWQEQYLTSERCESVRYSFHENMKFISWS